MARLDKNINTGWPAIQMLGGFIVTVILGGFAALAWVEKRVDEHVDARMKDGEFRRQIMRDLNQVITFDNKGTITWDPAKLYGALVTEVKVDKKSDSNITIITLKLSKNLAFEPVLTHLGGLSKIVAKRLPGPDWEFNVERIPVMLSSEGPAFPDPQYTIQFLPESF